MSFLFSSISKKFMCAARKLDGFPYLRRVKTMLLNNNRIVRVGEDLQINLPHLETLMLTNNSIQVTSTPPPPPPPPTPPPTV